MDSSMRAKDIINFTKTNWAQLATFARGTIVQDMNNGVLQNGRKKYKSKEYAARKATGKLGKFRKSDSVTMMLSGDTKNRIRPEGKKDRAVVVFERGDIVEWNEKNNNYIIADLSSKNKDLCAHELQKIVDRNAKKYESKPVKIKIGK